MKALEESLRRRFRVAETEVVVGDRSISLLHPASAEELINERDFARDERLPYWAELWPSARILAGQVLGMSSTGSRVIELGCGSGLVACCAALAGFRVTVTDYYEDATRFARLNAWRNTGVAIRARMVDWRAIPAKLGRFELVLASDVLYERPYGALVAGAISKLLAPGGRAIVADPGRVGREPFLSALPERRLAVARARDLPYADGDIRQTITCYEIERAGDDPTEHPSS
jgi:predicted nicotinamide N-methyase